LDDTWTLVERLRDWLDAESPVPADTAKLMRVLKIGEEFGEVAEAVHGVTGTNPRKGHSHTWDDVHTELSDVILTAMIALATLTPDARQVFEARLHHIAARSLQQPPAAASAT
jgi:NTP pyrophosphatase (non-canonical NTP hydrolase)